MHRLTLAAVALLAATAPGWAQFDPTVIPSQPAQPAPSPGPSIVEGPLDEARSGDQLPAQGVYQQGLDMLDPSSPGILTQANGGFPGSMWQGSDRRALVALMPRMPVGKGSPAMRSLAERLLLTPHIAGVTRQASTFLFQVACDNVKRVVADGQPPLNRVY